MQIIVLILLAVVILSIIVAFIYSPGTLTSFSDKEGTIIEDSISVKDKMTIGGVEQGIIIEGRDISNPILLVLHGGPGSTEYSSFKSYNVGLEEMFTVCYWEQRGSGISYNKNIDPTTMTLEQFISDAIEVTNYLRGRFSEDKIYILGHSWGTLLGMHVIKNNPELYHAYIGMGQIGNGLESEKEIYNFMLDFATENADKKTLEELDSWDISNDAIFSNSSYLQMRMKYVLKFGGGITREMKTMTPVLISLLTCKAYTISEKISFFKGIEFSGTLMSHLVLEANLNQAITKVDIPVFILQGIYDGQTSYNQARSYYNIIEAPVKQFYTFENSAHSPAFEEPEKFIGIMIDDVLSDNK